VEQVPSRPQRPIEIGRILVEVPLKKPAIATGRGSNAQRDEDAPSHGLDPHKVVT
jgi:hypothetical protein